MRAPIIKNVHVNRPVRVPTDHEARYALAKVLAAYRWEKARRILGLPLFEVALEGHHGVALAEAFARSRNRRAA